MKKNLLPLLCFCGVSHAQDYVPLQINSGYNADVIANGVGPALLSTTASFDSFEFVLLSSDYRLLDTDPTSPFALDPSGAVANAAVTGLNYQLAPFSGDNSLRLEFESDMGQLTIGNGVSATNIYVLAACGNGAGTLGGTIRFTDNSTQAIVQGVIPDWFFSNALPVVASGFGRVGRDTDMVENPTGNPRFYQYQIAILPENQTKTIASIDFTKVSTAEAVINVLAVTAQTLGTCPAPDGLSITNITNNGFTANWNTPVINPSLGYQYYVSPSPIPPTQASSTTGDVLPGVNTFSISGLITGQQYCVWVRSVCDGPELGQWSASVCVTPGELAVNYPNDIPTLFADTVDLSSTTTCPGVMTINVPAGYVITSVATSYDMQTASNGWISEQNTLLVCNTTGMMETAVTTGVGNNTGTFTYSRSGLDIADGATGAVEFELRAWRTYGGADCNTDYNRVVAGTWNVTVTLSDVLATQSFQADAFAVYPNPADDVINISGSQTISEVSLYNLLGQKVVHVPANDKLITLDTSELAGGQYLLKIVSNNAVQTKSVLIR